MEKTKHHIFAILLMAFILVACGGHADRASLVAIDSLIMQNPDSACELLATYTADSLTTDDDRAYHALLTTIADYKAYRPATTDSIINIALNHYNHDGANQDKRMRSLLYKGCVMEELGDSKSAMRHYKEAQYACPDNDNFHKGYIYYKIGCLFQSVTEIEQAVNYYRKAISVFQDINETFYSLNCITSMGEILRISQPDTALKYIHRGLELALKQNDKYHVYAGYTNLAGYYFYYKNFDQAIKHSLLAINNSEITLDNNYAYYFAIESYLEKGKMDSAQKIHTSMPIPKTADDSIFYYRCLSDISKMKGDTTKSFIFNEEADKSQNNANKSANNGLSQICSAYDNDYASARNNTLLLYVIAFSSMIILFLILWQYKRINNAHALKQNLETLNIKMSDTVAELSKMSAGQSIANQNIETMKNTISQNIELLKKTIPWGISAKESKNEKIQSVMNNSFFANLYGFIDIEHPGLLKKLRTEFKLKEDEIRIVCLELCHFPNYIIWSSTNLTNIHSLINKKKIIAKKVNGATSISEIVSKI